MGFNLWQSTEPKHWQDVKATCTTLLEQGALSPGELFFQKQLPMQLKQQLEHDEKGMTKHQLVQLVQWKLKRGKMRPRLLGFAKEQDEDALEKATKEAYQQIVASSDATTVVPVEDVMKGLDSLIELRGIGPATASAILSAMHPSIPFMSDEALEVVRGKREYTRKAYQELLVLMREKLRDLNGGGLDSGGEEDVLTARDMELCLYWEEKASKGNGETTKTQRTRQRGMNGAGRKGKKQKR